MLEHVNHIIGKREIEEQSETEIPDLQGINRVMSICNILRIAGVLYLPRIISSEYRAVQMVSIIGNFYTSALLYSL